MKTFAILDGGGEARGIVCGSCVAQFGIPPEELVEIDQCDTVKACDACGQRILASWRLNYLDRLCRSKIHTSAEKQKLGEEMLRS